MKWSEFFTSSVGKKVVMALTGLFLISFLVIHVSINACIFNDLYDQNDNGDMFNRAAHFMATSMLVRTLEFGLFIGILLHMVQGFVLEIQNRSKRSQGYQVPMGSRGSKWYSKSMGLLGTLLLLFLIMHISHFWVPSRWTGLEEVEGKNYHNLFIEMVRVFQSPLVVILYVLGCISLAFHLLHGFQSAFRTLGVHNSRYIKIVRGLGAAFSVIVPLVFASMPVLIYLGYIG